MIILKSLGCI